MLNKLVYFMLNANESELLLFGVILISAILSALYTINLMFIMYKAYKSRPIPVYAGGEALSHSIETTLKIKR